MSEASSKPNPGRDKAQPRIRRVYLLFELMALVVLAGALVWLLFNYPPRGPIASGLLNTRLWILVLLVSVWGTAGSLIPYYVGQRGTEAVFERYPKLEGRPWERLEAVYQRSGSLTLILSGIPLLGAALLVAAGAFGVQRKVFLSLVFVGKLLRYWVLVFIFLIGLELVG